MCVLLLRFEAAEMSTSTFNRWTSQYVSEYTQPPPPTLQLWFRKSNIRRLWRSAFMPTPLYLNIQYAVLVKTLLPAAALRSYSTDLLPFAHISGIHSPSRVSASRSALLPQATEDILVTRFKKQMLCVHLTTKSPLTKLWGSLSGSLIDASSSRGMDTLRRLDG